MRVSVEKGYIPGCIGRICELHARFYSKLVGFGLPFESKVAREFTEFCTRYDGQRDGLWLAIFRMVKYMDRSRSMGCTPTGKGFT